nr:hypothetical protein BaRGS_005559 [Batillaria attramentaria]
MTSVFGKDRYHSQRRNALPDIFESVDVTEAAGHVTSDADSGHQDTNNTSLLFEALKQNEIVNKMASKDGDNNSANNPKSEETARSRTFLVCV